jgi:PHD/YefM family antitoxin component YafN of YafNO toxin-antitoxin module
MRRFSSTQAKQSFGDLLRAAQDGPVAIERHRKVQAIVASPDRFAELDAQEARRSARRLARAQQDLVERDRLIKHQQLAIDLLTQPASERSALIRRARAVVDQWRARGLCSVDYIDRWSRLLALPPRELAQALASDADGWGTALRQNSPFIREVP